MAASNNQLAKRNEVSTEVAGQMMLSPGFIAAAEGLIAAGDADRDFSLQLEGIIKAESMDDVFKDEDESSAISFKDYVDKPFTINDVKIQRSTLKDGMPFFVVVFATDINGKEIVLTSGSGKVVAQLIRAKELGGLPALVKIKEYITNGDTKMRELVRVKAF